MILFIFRQNIKVLGPRVCLTYAILMKNCSAVELLNTFS